MTTFAEWFDENYGDDSFDRLSDSILCRMTAEHAWNKAIAVATEDTKKAIFVNSATQALHAIVHAEIEAYRDGRSSHPADRPEETAKQAVKIARAFMMALLDEERS